MAETTLRCSKCNAEAPAGAVAGGKHYLRHRTENRGRNHKPFDRATSCGTWVEVKTEEVQRG